MFTDPKKVIRGLECCLAFYDRCNECPYLTGVSCAPAEVKRDALTLLKAQMPRVMTWREIVHSIEIEAPALWLEDRDKIHVIPALTIISGITNSENATFVIRGKRINAKHSDYGKRWRAWTAHPTEEQRKAVKWND